MKAMHLTFPRRYFIGQGALQRAVREFPSLGQRAVIVTGQRWARESGTLDRLIHLLAQENLETLVLPGIPPNPDRSDINQRAREASAWGPHFFVALGGGSVMDATKAIALVSREGRDIWDYITQRPRKVQAYPVVAIATVAASGSEFDGAAVINHRALKAKMPLSYPALTPHIAVVDPELQASVPPYLTALGVVDIFCQFLEPHLLAEAAFAPAESLSRTALRLVVDLGRAVLRHPQDLTLRAELGFLASLSMSQLGRIGRGGKFSLHWLEHVLSGYYPEIPHPQGLASLLPAYLAFHIARRPEAFHDVAITLLGTAAPQGLVPFLQDWLQDLGVARNLQSLGVRREDLAPMARDVVQQYGWEPDGRVAGPVPMGEAEILAIYTAAFEGGTP